MSNIITDFVYKLFYSPFKEQIRHTIKQINNKSMDYIVYRETSNQNNNNISTFKCPASVGEIIDTVGRYKYNQMDLCWKENKCIIETATYRLLLIYHLKSQFKGKVHIKYPFCAIINGKTYNYKVIKDIELDEFGSDSSSNVNYISSENLIHRNKSIAIYD